MSEKKDRIDFRSFHGKSRKTVRLEVDDSNLFPRLVILPIMTGNMQHRFPVYGQVEQDSDGHILACLFDIMRDDSGNLGIPNDKNPRVFKMGSVGRAINFISMMLAQVARTGLLNPDILELARDQFCDYSAEALEDFSADLELEEED